MHGQTRRYYKEEQKPYLPEFPSLKDEKATKLNTTEESALLKQFFR